MKQSALILVLLFTLPTVLRSQNIVCNDGFENHAPNKSWPTTWNQMGFAECWFGDDSYPYHSPDWMHLQGFHLTEDINGTGYISIRGNGLSQGYCGMIPAEGIIQDLNEDLEKDKLYGIRFYTRIPHDSNRLSTDSTKSYFPIKENCTYEITFSKNPLEYKNDSAWCASLENAYDLKYPGISGKQVVTFDVDYSKIVAGKWIEIVIPPFVAEKDWSHIFIQTIIENNEYPDCLLMALIDDFQIYGECTGQNDCQPSCSMIGNDINVGSNYVYSGVEPLEFYGVSNIKSAAVVVQSNVQLVHTVAYTCNNGWQTDTLQLDLENQNMSTGYYHAKVTWSNECQVCPVDYYFYWEDYYQQPFESCTCRVENTVKPCCENMYEALEPVLKCGMNNSITHYAIDDLEVGVLLPFTVPDTVHMNFHAGNSVKLGGKFSSGQGTFKASVYPCGANKRGRNYYSNSTHEEDETDNEVVIGEFSCYPNPTKGVFTMVNSSDKNCVAALYTANGVLVSSVNLEPSTEETLDLSAKESGVYFVRFMTETRSETQKIILEK